MSIAILNATVRAKKNTLVIRTKDDLGYHYFNLAGFRPAGGSSVQYELPRDAVGDHDVIFEVDHNDLEQAMRVYNQAASIFDTARSFIGKFDGSFEDFLKKSKSKADTPPEPVKRSLAHGTVAEHTRTGDHYIWDGSWDQAYPWKLLSQVEDKHIMDSSHLKVVHTP